MVVLGTGIFRTGVVGAVLISHAVPHSLSRVTFTHPHVPHLPTGADWSWSGRTVRKTLMLCFLSTCRYALGCHCSSPQASQGFSRCISKDLPQFPRTFPMLQTCLGASNQRQKGSMSRSEVSLANKIPAGLCLAWKVQCEHSGIAQLWAEVPCADTHRSRAEEMCESAHSSQHSSAGSSQGSA